MKQTHCPCGELAEVQHVCPVTYAKLESQLTAEREHSKSLELTCIEMTRQRDAEREARQKDQDAFQKVTANIMLNLVGAKQRAEAAEARIKASQEQAPVNHLWYRDGVWCPAHATAKDELRPVYAQPPITPEVAELQRENAELHERLSNQTRKLGDERERAAELQARIAELEKDAKRYRWIMRQGVLTDAIFAYAKMGERHVSNEIDAAIEKDLSK